MACIGIGDVCIMTGRQQYIVSVYRGYLMLSASVPADPMHFSQNSVLNVDQAIIASSGYKSNFTWSAPGCVLSFGIISRVYFGPFPFATDVVVEASSRILLSLHCRAPTICEGMPLYRAIELLSLCIGTYERCFDILEAFQPADCSLTMRLTVVFDVDHILALLSFFMCNSPL